MPSLMVIRPNVKEKHKRRHLLPKPMYFTKIASMNRVSPIHAGGGGDGHIVPHYRFFLAVLKRFKLADGTV